MARLHQRTYAAEFTVGAGQHTIVIEYYEAFAGAFLDVNFSSVSGSPLPGVQPTPAPTTPPQPVPDGPTATVLAWRLNVRDAPSASGTM